MANRLRHAGRPQPLDGLTVSLGVAAAQGVEVDLVNLTRRADRALCEAKAAGRDQVLTADASSSLRTGPRGHARHMGPCTARGS